MKANHDNNFWEINSDLLAIKELNTLYQKDTTKQKSTSSNLMWAIYYAYNPESKFYALPNKLEMLEKNFIKDSKFKWAAYKEIVDIYCNVVLTDAERALLNWSEIMVMRDKSIKELYVAALSANNTDELVKLDKMLANTPKLFEDYKKIKKDYEEEKTLKKGKHIQSLTESGEI